MGRQWIHVTVHCLEKAPRKKLVLVVIMEVAPLYEYIAMRVAKYWNKNGNCALVVGATAPEELARVRRAVGDMQILVPGIGAQGGSLEATVKVGADSHGIGMIINSSRGIIFASKGEDFAAAAYNEAKKLNDAIKACLASRN
jgi:orotidine-5'-phosphate decarboxylase